MAYDLTSPSGDVTMHIAERFGARWAIWVRGERLADGRFWRSWEPMLEAAEGVAATCDETPGLGDAGGDLRDLVALFRNAMEEE